MDTPKRWRKDDYGQKEEDAGDLEPEDSADAAKGAEKAADAAGDASAGPGSRLPDRLNGGPGASGVMRSGCGCLRGLRQALPDHAAGDAQSRAKKPANRLRSHSVMMVAATLTK
jgi:hypothetical protein